MPHIGTIFDEDGNIIEDTVEQRMQKYLVIYSFLTPRENQGPLTLWDWAFSKTIDKALEKAKDKLASLDAKDPEQRFKDKPREVFRVWTIEMCNFSDKLTHRHGIPSNNAEVSIIQSMVKKLRFEYNVHPKSKGPKGKRAEYGYPGRTSGGLVKLPDDIPPFETEEKHCLRLETQVVEEKPTYRPYNLMSGGEYLKKYRPVEAQ